MSDVNSNLYYIWCKANHKYMPHDEKEVIKIIRNSFEGNVAYAFFTYKKQEDMKNIEKMLRQHFDVLNVNPKGGYVVFYVCYYKFFDFQYFIHCDKLIGKNKLYDRNIHKLVRQFMRYDIEPIIDM